MREVILKKLKEIESQENVTILYAVESGSRAWGFESLDSDYDVRFIYVRKETDYLNLFSQSDVIEYELNDVYDIHGWDIQKALRLLYKSNPSLYEWLNSPIVYKTTDLWEKLKPLLLDTFQLSPLFKHYYYMTFHSLSKQGHAKSYFYSLRSLLSCLWIIHQNTPPPIELDLLIKEELNPAYTDLVHHMIELKKKHSEYIQCNELHQLDDYMYNKLLELQNQLPMFKETSFIDQHKLQFLFLHILKEGQN